MLHYGSRVNSVTTMVDTQDQPNERTIHRLRLTLHPSEINNEDETRKADRDSQGETVGIQKKRSSYVKRERPLGAELNVKQPGMANGAGQLSSPSPDGPKLYAVVQRTDMDRKQDVMACEWPISHLREEVNYIREVRESLEKVRERMYGQFGGIQQTMQRLSQEMRSQVANGKRWNLEAETPPLDRCSNCEESRSKMQDTLGSWEQAEERLREMDRKLIAAQAENQTLRLQVESSQEANSWALRDLTQRLQSQYEAQLQEQQQKHREEMEVLRTHLDECMKRAEEAEGRIKAAEAEIAERDERIREVERLLGCMGQEKRQLEQKLQECEQRLHRLQQAEYADAAIIRRSRQLAEEAAELKERIGHLNDMVFNQQKKVKGLIRQVEALNAVVAQKEMYVTELVDRIAILECENKELEDKLNYYMSLENGSGSAAEMRDVGVHCDLPNRPESLEETQSRSVDRRSELASGPDASLCRCTHIMGPSSGRLSRNEMTTNYSYAEQSNILYFSPRPKIYTPYMKLMEITAAIKIK